jgi:Zn-dependent protease with chaperone function
MSETIRQKHQFPNISPHAWEHPADKAALAALQAVPGVGILLQKCIGATSETAFRLIYLASAVRASERQFPHVYTLLHAACQILDAPYVPEIYIAHNPFFNAGAIGVDRPFIALHSSVLETLTEEELLCVIGHELGHCLSGHALYKTLLQMLINLSIAALQIPLGGAALVAIMIALMEWNRKSELSADRAGLLVVQDPTVSYSLLMKMAGGPQAAQMDVNAFFAQAAEYEGCDKLLTSIHKLLNLVFVSHPFPVIRLTELQSWVNSGQYTRILSQNYAQREAGGSAGTEPIFAHFKEASQSYKAQLDTSTDALAGLMSEVLDTADAWTQQAIQGIESMFDFAIGQTKEPPTGVQDSPTSSGSQTAHEQQNIFVTLEKLRHLKDKGVITEEDFEAQKTKLLKRL